MNAEEVMPQEVSTISRFIVAYRLQKDRQWMLTASFPTINEALSCDQIKYEQDKIAELKLFELKLPII